MNRHGETLEKEGSAMNQDEINKIEDPAERDRIQVLFGGL